MLPYVSETVPHPRRADNPRGASRMISVAMVRTDEDHNGAGFVSAGCQVTLSELQAGRGRFVNL